MEHNYPKPRWWRLYAIVLVTLVLLVIDSQLALPSLGHKLVEIMIVLLTVVLMGLWVMANAVALEQSDIADERAPDVTARAARLRQPRPEAVSRRADVSLLRTPIDMAAPGRERNN